MLITHCYIQNTDDTEHQLGHHVFISAPHVSGIPVGIVECRAGRLSMPPGVVFRVPVSVWAEAGRKQSWCRRLSDAEVEEMLGAIRGESAETGEQKPARRTKGKQE